MKQPMRVSCSEFRANYGRYLDITLTEPVIVANFARDEGVLIAAEVFRTLCARLDATAQKPIGPPIVVPISDFLQRHPHYQRVAFHNPVIITTHDREKIVLLSPEAFYILFDGSPPQRVLATTDVPQKVTTSEFQQNVGHYLDVALRSPIILTKHGREKNVVLSVAAFRTLRRTKAGKAQSQLASALTATFTDFDHGASHYQDLAVTRPIIITANEREQNALISVDVFKRLKSKAKPDELR